MGEHLNLPISLFGHPALVQLILKESPTLSRACEYMVHCRRGGTSWGQTSGLRLVADSELWETLIKMLSGISLLFSNRKSLGDF